MFLAILPRFPRRSQTNGIQGTYERKEQTSGKYQRENMATWQCGALLRKEGENDLKAS